MNRTTITGDDIKASRYVLLVIMALLLPVFLSLFLPRFARATWPVEDNPRVLLGFHDTYNGSGRKITHLGADLVASGGSSVIAPVKGTVSFIGRVPASDAATSETMLAVSLALVDGRIFTMMPFETVVVREGAELSEGATVGTLAADGDRSSSAAHLHVGLKEEGVYYDPLTILGSASVGEKSSSEAGEGIAANPAFPTASGELLSTSSSVATSMETMDARTSEGEDTGTARARASISSAGATAADLSGRGIEVKGSEQPTLSTTLKSFLQGLQDDICSLIAAEFPFLADPVSAARMLVALLGICCCAAVVLGLYRMPWRKVVSKGTGLVNARFSAVRGAKGEGRGSDKGNELVMPAGQ